jgi:hypothetical protein
MGMTMQHPRLWLLPLPQRIIYALLSRLPGEREQHEVDHDGQGDAQEDAHQQPEKAPSSHRLDAFRRVGYAPVVSSGDHLRLEYDYFQDRFQIAHYLRLSLRA